MFLEHFVEQKYGKAIREENISAWRRAISGNLTSCFRPHDPHETDLDYLDRNKFVVDIQKARFKKLPSDYKKLSDAEIMEVNEDPVRASVLPRQEAGIRPACALPYELYVNGALMDGGSAFSIRFKAGADVHGSRSAGSPFNVYLRNVDSTVKESGSGLIASTYVVKAGDQLEETFPLALFEDGNYSCDVHGPNGFFRSFKGGANGPRLDINVLYERNGSEPYGDLVLQLLNKGEVTLDLLIGDRSYRSGSRKKRIGKEHTVMVPLSLRRSRGWYDVTVEAKGFSFLARYAGRVETGSAGFTDPLMGGLV